MQDFWGRLQNISNWGVFYLLVAVVLVSSFGSAVTHAGGADLAWWSDWLRELSTELIGALTTFGLLVLLVTVRNDKRTLLQQLRSADDTTIKNVIEQLRAKGWLIDGSLAGASLFEANFAGANLSAANLSGASLFKADLSGTSLGFANLGGAYLHYANLSGAHLRGTNLTGAHLRFANLAGADIEEVRFDSNTILPDGSEWTADTDMQQFTHGTHEQFWRGYQLAEQDLTGQDFSKANLSGADISEAKLTRVNLSGAKLKGAHLQYTNLSSANLREAQLGSANLSNANLGSADLAYANLERANLRGANFFQANLERANLRHAQFDENTIMPDGSKWDAATDTKMQFFALQRFTDANHPQFWRSTDPNSPAQNKG